VNEQLNNLIQNFDLNKPYVTTPKLYQIQLEILNLNTKLITRKFAECNKVIQLTNGMFTELIADNYYYSSDDTAKIIINCIHRSDFATSIALSKGLKGDIKIASENLKRDSLYSFKSNLFFNEMYSEYNGNYWLNKPVKANLFQTKKPELIGIPEMYDYPVVNSLIFQPSKNIVNSHFNNLMLHYKWTEPEKGELYRPVVIAPPVMINPQIKLLTFTDNKTKELRVNLKAGRDTVNGLIQIALPKGWNVVLKGSKFNNQLKAPRVIGFTFSLAKKGEIEEIALEINPYEGAQDTTININALVNGQSYTKGIKEIKYDHIPIQTLFPEAEVKLVKLDVVKKSKRIGYIPGAGDEVQACLIQLGYEVITLTDDKLANENLNQYEAIIAGVRAYNTNNKLLSFKQKLMDYVSAGGNLIVQYNTNSWAGPLSSDIGPYKFKITRNRITDEEAKVNFLLPNHPVLNTPNKISDKDFEGWVQERSIYHAGDWDSNYVAPISMTDPYEMTVGGISPKGKPENGALIIAKHGKGNFVYTGLVFFRQLPAGIPGAYRLMVNLIELGKP
jgi:hypothetical protein